MSEDKVRIIKVGGPSSTPMGGAKKTKARKAKIVMDKKPKFGILKGGKTARTNRKIEGVKDPAKAPPHRKSARTLRVLTDKGLSERRKKIEQEASKTSIHDIRRTLRKHGMAADGAPEKLAREIYGNAREAGMISPS
jgi:hypothetical protein